ncbi:M14 family metallopeptidase [Balneatrix alpica]|uniref:Succinylglutamate desuccinylase/aspartoacylase family protein n=1 Tax=Balneatrix alpica TaxID=75684 RepID=A0ABV5ZAM0_9GAMM|nr:succinylglutamate desuccinylase/aspartoacylase family protein [Balneatrix alpica]
MQIETLCLEPGSPGRHHQLQVWHFGQPDAEPCVYLQAGLHADESPGSLVLHRLIACLQHWQDEGRLRGRVIVVPMANPLGLGQWHLGLLQGRFEARSGQNFNRHFPLLAEQALTLLAQQEQVSSHQARDALLAALQQQPGLSELEQLQGRLFALALQADVILDLHCDSEACLHLYANEHNRAQVAELAQHLQVPLVLLAEEAGGMSFDDAIMQNWLRLRQHYADLPLPLAVTLELRGQLDTDPAYTEADVAGLLSYLCQLGVLAGSASARGQAAHLLPLAGVEALRAPMAGVVSYLQMPGRWLAAGTPLAWIQCPYSGQRLSLCAPQEGYFYARLSQRSVGRGEELCFIASRSPRRQGRLLAL